MKTNNLKILLFALLFLAVNACDGLIDTEPAQSVSTETAIQDIVGLESVLTGTYDRLQTGAYYGGDFMIVSEVLADNMKITTQNSNRFVTEWNNRPFAHFGFYNTAYDIINRANTVISAVPNVDADQALLDQIQGEALFIRALAHFDLVRSWARNPNHLLNSFDLGVVVKTEPFNGILDDNAFPERNTVNEVYTQVIQDLNDAISLLPASSNSNTFRASQVAAQALLSRVYLYQGDYESAITAATSAIDNSPVSLAGPSAAEYLTAFSEGSESLFEIEFTDAETRGLTSLAGLYRADIGYGDVVPTDELISNFDANDVRQDPLLLDPPSTKGSELVRFTRKYNGYDGTDLGTDNVIVIRLSEMYLNRAEAYVLQNVPNEALALQDLNTIRQQRGLTPLAVTGQALVDAIFLERRLELAFEGHRAYDLKRRGLGYPKPVQGDDLDYDSYLIVAPYYEAELDANPNIVQNPGYTSN